MVNGNAAGAHLFFRNTREILERDDPILLGYESLGSEGINQAGLIDASFAKLRRISASYTVPEVWADRVGANRMTLSLSAHNLWTIWQATDEMFGYPILDPEQRNTQGTTTDPGGLSAYVQEAWPPFQTLSSHRAGDVLMTRRHRRSEPMKIIQKSGMKGPRRGARALLGLVLSFSVLLGACDTEELLEVDLPGRVGEDALNDPRLAGTLTNSVIANVECAWDNYVAAASHHSDEYIQSSGNSTMKRWGLRDIAPTFDSYASGTCEDSYGLFTPMHTAHFQAESNFERISNFSDEEVPNKTALLATIRAYGAWPLIAFSEGFCGTPLDGGDEILTRQELARVAEEEFTEAIQLAQQAGLEEIEHLAFAGRARARLTLEDYAGAITDAEQVPEGFVFNATRDASPDERQNAHFEAVNGGTTAPASQKHATIAPNYRELQWKGVADPRVNTRWDGTLGFDFSTPHWVHDKVTSFDTPTMMASSREAQMFIAEAAAMTGDLDRAREILNQFHSAAGLPPVTEADIPTQDAVIEHIIEERRREFFVEGGHRLRDHLRWRGTPFEVPFLGEPGSIHPNGVDQYGQPYEDATCFPVPAIEQSGA